MKVLQVNKFHYRRGGAETVYFATTDLLRARGHEVVHFSMQDPRNEPSPCEKYFVSNVELREEQGGIVGTLAAAGRILYSREAEQKIEALLDAERPDVAHLHNIYHQISPSILRALKRRRVPVVMTLHDYKIICPAYTLYTQGDVCDRCRGGRYYNAVRYSCVKDSRAKSALCATEAYVHAGMGIYRRNVKLFVAPSHFMARKVIEFGTDPRRVTYVPNFIDVAPCAPPPTGERYFLFAGRLEKVKGVTTLLRAMSAESAAGGVQLLIAGDGEERPALEARARQEGAANVRFLGQLPPHELAPLLAGAMFVAVPSEWHENAPLSVLEAAAHAKAVIASDLGGLPELVRHGETGLIVRAGDAAALRAAIQELAADSARTAVMGQNARALVEREFSPDNHYRALMSVYERAMRDE